MQAQTRQIGIFATLALLMASTRLYSHLGSATLLPDASWAIFFIAGFYLARSAWPAAAAFAFLLLEAGAVDYYAIAFRGVSSECFSPAYWFLIPTYASLWYGGRWIAPRLQNNLAGLGLLAVTATTATTAAFLISNLSYYLLSPRFTDMSLAQYAGSVAQYYPQYLGYTLLYIACAAALHALFGQAGRDAHSPKSV